MNTLTRSGPQNLGRYIVSEKFLKIQRSMWLWPAWSFLSMDQRGSWLEVFQLAWQWTRKAPLEKKYQRTQTVNARFRHRRSWTHIFTDTDKCRTTSYRGVGDSSVFMRSCELNRCCMYKLGASRVETTLVDGVYRGFDDHTKLNSRGGILKEKCVSKLLWIFRKLSHPWRRWGSEAG